MSSAAADLTVEELVVYDADEKSALLFQRTAGEAEGEGVAAGSYGFFAGSNINGGEALLADLLRTMGISGLDGVAHSEMVPMGTKRTPHFGHAQSTTRTITFYGLQGGRSLEARLPPQPPRWTWLRVADALRTFAAGEALFSPHTIQLLSAIHASAPASPRSALAQAARRLLAAPAGLGLATPLLYAPRLELVPLAANTIPPFSKTNLVLLRAGAHCLMADPAAAAASREEFDALLRSLPSNARVQCVLTHHHRDHVEGLAQLAAAFPSAEVLAHPKCLSRVRTTLPTRPVQDGEKLRVGDEELTVVGCPGHTDGHIGLFEPIARTLVAGDHVVGIGSAVLDPECGDMRDYFESTRRLMALRPRVIYPAHGPPHYDGTKLLETYLLHRQQREDAILASYRRGNTTPLTIVTDVYKDVPPQMHAFAARNVELHLRKLQQEAKL